MLASRGILGVTYSIRILSPIEYPEPVPIFNRVPIKSLEQLITQQLLMQYLQPDF